MANDIQQFAPFNPTRIRFIARNKVLFRRLPTDLKVGLIHLPGTSRYLDRNDVAEIIAVGDGVTEVKAGDKVVLPWSLDVCGKFSHEGETYTFIGKDALAGVAVVEG